MTTPSVFQDLQEETITLGFVREMIADFKNGKLLDKKYVYKILEQTRDLFLPLTSVVGICVPDGKHLTVCDDLHCQFEDLMHMFELNGMPSEDNPYIFTGELENRGEFSVEVLLTLLAFKCWCPSAIYLTSVNHVDDEHMNKVYGFEREVNSKLGEEFLQHFVEIFHGLPRAYVINQKIAVPGAKYKVDPFCESPVKGLKSIYFCDIAYKLGLVVTSDEATGCKSYKVEFDDKTITIFLASNYYKITFPTKDIVQEIMVFAEQVLGGTIICGLVCLMVIAYFFGFSLLACYPQVRLRFEI